MSRFVKFCVASVFILFFVLNFASCAGSPVNHDDKEAELTVTYFGKKVYERKAKNKGGIKGVKDLPNYNSKEDLKMALEGQTRPLYIIYSGDSCPPCKQLVSLIKINGWRSNVIILNIDETWAYLLYKELGFNGIPAMSVIHDKKVFSFSGYVNISRVLWTMLGKN